MSRESDANHREAQDARFAQITEQRRERNREHQAKVNAENVSPLLDEKVAAPVVPDVADVAVVVDEDPKPAAPIRDDFGHDSTAFFNAQRRYRDRLKTWEERNPVASPEPTPELPTHPAWLVNAVGKLPISETALAAGAEYQRRLALLSAKKQQIAVWEAEEGREREARVLAGESSNAPSNLYNCLTDARLDLVQLESLVDAAKNFFRIEVQKMLDAKIKSIDEAAEALKNDRTAAALRIATAIRNILPDCAALGIEPHDAQLTAVGLVEFVANSSHAIRLSMCVSPLTKSTVLDEADIRAAREKGRVVCARWRSMDSDNSRHMFENKLAIDALVARILEA